jgi:integrase
MPATYEMSWEPVRRRWWKQYRGRRYLVSCRQLGTRETKDASYQAANAWWLAKKIEIDGQHPNADRIREQRRRLEWSQQHGRADLIQELRSLIAQLEDDMGRSEPVTAPSPLSHLLTVESAESYRQLCESVGKSSPVADVVEEVIEERIWQERLSDLDQRESVPDQDRSVAHQVQLWLDDLRTRVTAGQFGPGELRGQISYIRHFVTYLGEQTLIDAIDEERWAGYHRHLMQRIGIGECSPEYGKKLHRSARSWIEYLTALRRIPAPGNLHDKKMRFHIPKKTIEVFEGPEIKRLLDESRDMIRVMILLALNCGMTQIDISDLTHNEIDWGRGRLTRKRSKTADHAKTPLVEYPLWSETFALLARLRSSDPVRVLVTKSGKPWVNRRETNIDSVRIEFEKLEPALSFKHLRKTAATMLGRHGEYRAYAQFFLGHAPDSVADSHYVRPDQGRFDSAVDWLRDQFLRGEAAKEIG